MDFVKAFKQQIFSINEESFEDSSLAVFDYQYHQCDIYQQYCRSLGKNPTNVNSLFEIPFLPIEFFKNHTIKSGDWTSEKLFKSSGTTDTGRSTHHIPDLAHYHNVSKRIFEDHFGTLNDFKIMALLPSYQEQGDSSLISMVDHFMGFSKKGSGYFLNQELSRDLMNASNTILFGVSYALLDLAENIQLDHNDLVLIETGGMKGRKKEITRSELHQTIKRNLNPKQLWSEYGMTELQSQAYGKEGEFRFPPWARALIREAEDPFSYHGDDKTGGINVIDLANIQSCSFIETKDLGKSKNGFFEVLGRFDHSDIRGCNLLV